MPFYRWARKGEGMSSKTVRQLLGDKGTKVFAVSPDASVYEAIELMAKHEVGALVVTSGDRLVGMLSERDYARKVILLGRASRDTKVRDVMTEKVITVGLQDTVSRCMQIMTERRIRHLPVMDADALVGLVSIGDLVKTIIAEQAFEIEQLQGYIAGTV
jgi:CBS domain-containing protein